MSQFVTLETQFVSAEHLLRALKDLGFDDAVLHQTPQPLRGTQAGGPRVEAEIVVPRKGRGGRKGDFGFKRGPDGTYQTVYYDMDQARFNPAWLNKLTQRYAYQVARDALRKQEFDLVEETVDQDNTIRLTVRRMR